MSLVIDIGRASRARPDGGFGRTFPCTACAIYLRKKPVGCSCPALEAVYGDPETVHLLQDRFGWYEYQDWIRENEGNRLSAGLKMHAEGLAYRARQPAHPLEGPSMDGLSGLFKILAAQWYENWEACLILGSNIGEGGFKRQAGSPERTAHAAEKCGSHLDLERACVAGAGDGEW